MKRNKLVRNKRAEEDPEFAELILNIGDGDYDQTTDEPCATVKLPEKFLASPNDEVEQLIERTYGDLIVNTRNVTHSNLKLFADRCIVAPTNDATNEINEKVLAMLEDCEEVESCEEFLSCDSIQ